MFIRGIALLVVFSAIINNCGCNNDIQTFDIKPYELFYNCLFCKASEDCCNIMCGIMTLARLQLFDASSKTIITGIMDGNLFDLGKYDECLETTEMFMERQWHGKYCLATVSFQFNMENADRNTSGLRHGYCLPSVCSAEDFELMIASPLKIIADENNCYSKAMPLEYDAGAITGLVIIAIALTFVTVSTGYDVYLQYSEEKPKHELLVAFSLILNGKKLFESTNNPNQLLCLNGIKAMSIMWVMLGHQLGIGMIAADNVFTGLEMNKESKWLFLLQYELAVDTFLLVSGILIVYTFLRGADRGASFNIFKFYGHRYLRLTPVYAMMIYFQAFLLKHMAEGPFWSSIDSGLAANCRKWWWTSLLYVQNYVNIEEMCIPPSWYLSVDFQLYLLTPLVLLPLRKWPQNTAYFGIIGLCIAGVISPFLVTYLNEVPAYSVDFTVANTKYITYYYHATHARFGPYVIGMLFGYFIYEYKKSEVIFKMKTVPLLLMWIVCIGGLFGCVYGSFNARLEEYDRISSSLYLSLNKPAWALVVGMVIYLCITGNGGPVDVFLSHPVFQFLTKMCYTLYIVHYTVISAKYASVRTAIHFSLYQVLTDYWGIFAVSLSFALCLCLTFEYPFLIIDKYVFGRGEVKKPKEKKDLES